MAYIWYNFHEMSNTDLTFIECGEGRRSEAAGRARVMYGEGWGVDLIYSDQGQTPALMLKEQCQRV